MKILGKKTFIAILSLIFLSVISLIFERMRKRNDIAYLEKIASTIDLLALVALAITLALGILAFYYKIKLNRKLELQREVDQLNIAKSTEISEQAKRDASIANENAAKSNERSEIAKKEAALAIENASKSNEMAEAAKKDAAIANSKIAVANERSEQAKKEAAISLEKAAIAELKSAEIEMQLVKLKFEVAPRYMPTFIAESLKAILSNQKKTILLQRVISNDQETLSFAESLRNFFKTIGWKTEIADANNIIIPPPTGFAILYNGDQNKKSAEAIYQEFKKINYECSLHKAPSLKYDFIIQIYAK